MSQSGKNVKFHTLTAHYKFSSFSHGLLANRWCRTISDVLCISEKPTWHTRNVGDYYLYCALSEPKHFSCLTVFKNNLPINVIQ